MTAQAKIHEVIFKVRPAVGHPKFYDFQYAWLEMWLYADSKDDAKARAEVIFAQLPYDQLGTQVGVHTNLDKSLCDPAKELHREILHAIAIAEHVGFSMLIHGNKTGTDGEAEFAANAPV